MYMSILKNKQGERKAVSMLDQNIVDNFLPTFIVDDYDDDVLKKLASIYSEKTLIDVRNLGVDEILELKNIISSLPELSHFNILYPIDVILSAPEIEDINFARIDKTKLNAFFIQWAKANISSLPLNLVFDFEYIESEDQGDSATHLLELLNELSSDYHAFIVSGAIKKTIPVKVTENYRLERIEKKLLQTLSSKVESDVHLHYGDYTVVHPIPSDPAPITPVVQIKYTTDDNIDFFRNGQRRGNYEFFKVCSDIVNSNPDFDPLYCWADTQIQEVHDAQQNRGNAATWAAYGINRHISVNLK
ncbi:hypothetical protein LIBO111022_15780 [Listeria booriae]|uniref:Beta protein n=2 Tax=Listeria booriae TaxID=1552123 RepID=A0A099W641_9LIST|nr:hypothetical protein EP57_12490 [Listeria booriae]STY40396.1 Uncharacterised protein [Listeria booriae]